LANLLEGFYRDFRFALRSFARDGRFVFLAIFSWALGIGSATLVFSVVYSVLFHPLPYRDFNRLVVFQIHDLEKADEGGRVLYSIPEFLAFREQNHVFEDLVAYNNDVNISYNDGKGARDILGTSGAQSHAGSGGAYVTTNTFQFYGMAPLLGRGITATDGDSDSAPVFVMNYRLWRNMFNGDPNVLGKTFILNGEPRVLVGIMPLRFQAYGASIWLPLSLKSGTGVSAMGLKIIGRLQSGMAVESASADLTVVARQLSELHPNQYPARFAVVVETLANSLVARFKVTLDALVAAVSMLLLIACTNVANLLLARATTRQREIAVRASVGATRAALLRQLGVETFVLATAGCALGCFVAYTSLKWILIIIPSHRLPDEVAVKLDPVVLVFALVASAAIAVVCGLAPGFPSVSGDLQARLAGRGTASGFRHGKLRDALVIGEVALSLVLLIGAGLMMRSVFALAHINLGFDPGQVLFIRLDLPKDQYQTVAQRKILFQKIIDNVKALPGVIATAETWSLPPLDFKTTEVTVPGEVHSEPWNANLELCGEDYFNALGLKLLRGRAFSTAEVDLGQHVAVVNETLTRNYFANENPIGRKIKLSVLDRLPDAPHDGYFEIVGVVTDFKNTGLQNPVAPEAFLPNTISGFGIPTILVRTAAKPEPLLKSTYEAIWAAAPTIGINMSGSLHGILNEYVIEEPRFELVTFEVFAGVGLLLVLIGTFSVIAYNVSLHTHDIGVRMALGARQSDVIHLFLKRGLRLIGVGILAGVLASLGLTRFLISQLGSVSPTDPWAFAAAVACIVAVGLLACYLPARQASRVDPLTTLRYE
jgi:putative ABC transport system permease protein